MFASNKEIWLNPTFMCEDADFGNKVQDGDSDLNLFDPNLSTLNIEP